MAPAHHWAGAPPPATEEKEPNVDNRSDCIDRGVTEAFWAETGIEVPEDVFDSNEVLEPRLLTRNSGYDIVAPSAYSPERPIKSGMFRKLDKSKLSNPADLAAARALPSPVRTSS